MSIIHSVLYERFHCISMGLEEVSIIHSVLYERFHCISMGLEQVSIIHSVLYKRLHCISMGLEQVSFVLCNTNIMCPFLYNGCVYFSMTVLSNIAFFLPFQVTCLQFSANRIVSGSDDNTLRVWNAITGKVRIWAITDL